MLARSAGAADHGAAPANPAALASAPLILGELGPADVDAAPERLDQLAAHASASGNDELALAATLMGAAVRAPRLLTTWQDPAAGPADRARATFDTLSPVLRQINGLDGPCDAIGVAFACHETWQTLHDGKLSLDDALKPAKLMTKAAKLAGLPVPWYVDTAIVLVSVCGEIRASTHVVGYEDALRLDAALRG